MKVLLVILLCFCTNGLAQSDTTRTSEFISVQTETLSHTSTVETPTDSATLRFSTLGNNIDSEVVSTTPLSGSTSSVLKLQSLMDSGTTFDSTTSGSDYTVPTTWSTFTSQFHKYSTSQTDTINTEYTTSSIATTSHFTTSVPSTTTDVSTTIGCTDVDPPTLTFNEYVIEWDINQSNKYCVGEDITLTCDPGYEWLSKANTSLDVRTVNMAQNQSYTCSAFLTTIDGMHSPNSTILHVPPGTERMSMYVQNLSLSWEAPFENVTITYSLNISGTSRHTTPPNCNNTDIRNYVTNMTGASLEADYTYQVNIETHFWGKSIKNYSEFTTPSTAPGPPENVTVEAQNGSYSLSWDMPCYPNGEILGYNILLRHDTNTILYINFTESVNEYNFYTLEPDTEYALEIYTIGANNLRSETVNYTFLTSGLPNKPILTVLSQNSTYFRIGWKTQYNSPAMILKFLMKIDILGPSYNSTNGSCPQPPVIADIPLEVYVQAYDYNYAWPSYRYNISLIAYSEQGFNSTGYIELTTNFSVPEAVQNLSVSAGSINDNKIPVYLSWHDPCKINGAIEQYIIITKGKYTEDPSFSSISNTSIINQSIHTLLEPSHEYNFNVSIKLTDGTYGNWSNVTIITQVGYPGEPQITSLQLNSRNFLIQWQPPVEKTGPIDLYELYVKYVEPKYKIPTYCSMPPPKNQFFNVTDNKQNSYNVGDLLPYSIYEVKLRARTTPQYYGTFSVKNATTLDSVPDQVEDISTNCTSELTENYSATVNISFRTPCNMYGSFKNFLVICNGDREDYAHVNFTEVLDTANYDDKYNTLSTNKLSPQYKYYCTINTFNYNHGSTSELFKFTSPSGVPQYTVTFNSLPVINVSPEKVQINLRKTYFQSKQGDARYIALILNKQRVSNYTVQSWNHSVWPPLDDGSQQITPDFWYPFIDTDEVSFTVGNGSDLNPCLEDNKNYYLSARVFTDNLYVDSPTINFRTSKLSKLGVIVGVIVAILVLALLGISGFFVWKKKMYRKLFIMYQRRSVPKPVIESATAVPPKKFIQYFNMTKNKPEMLKEQFALINEKAKEIQSLHTSNFAGLLENRRKNRYVNILPFDATRVKLLIDEDDEIGSDYVNASYIKGYSGDIEYIATQGPLPTTCRDFWKLVLQENVTIIAMVANFVEKNKEKCHKYFPENHENLVVGDNMEIRCATELHFGTYVVRNLQVRKDCTQITVTHMQFLEWPDFRVPAGTEHMLQFCYQLRERSKLEGGVIIVHCSAGVGRTGTLIAADILLQTVAARKHLDVYKTVLDLRQQRCMMVQTEEQYVYIHRLLADHIDRPPTPEVIEATDPIYENMDIIMKPADSGYKNREEEESGF